MNPTNPEISVVIPTYNRAKLLMHAIDSVLAQTYQNYELVIIDDGSTDDTAERVKAYGRDIRYIYQQNGGASAAQNRGVQEARGKWISILASDDTWAPQKLAVQVDALKHYASDSIACITDCRFTGNPEYTQTAFESAGLAEGPETGLIDDPFRYIVGKNPALFVQSLMVDTNLLRELGGFDRQLKVAEDTDLFFRLCLRTKLSFVNRPLVDIDSQPQRTDKLSRAYHDNQEFQFKNRVYLFNRWLQLIAPAENSELASRITVELKNTYRHMLARRIKRFRLIGALQLYREFRRIGVSNTATAGRIADRQSGKR